MTGPLGFMGLVQNLKKKRPEIGEAHNPLFAKGFSFKPSPITMLIFFTFWGFFHIFFSLPKFCQFSLFDPPTTSGSKANLGPSGPWGLASNPVQ